ncbi:MAG: histidine kinase, partial [Bacteroidota bacterium]
MINTKLEKILASRVIQNIVFWIFYALIPFLINWSRYRVTADMLTDLQYYLDCALLGYINNFFLMPKFFDKKKYATYFLLVLSLIWGYNLVTEEIATYLSPNYKITTLGYIYHGLDFILFTVAFASGRLVRKYLHQEKLITQLKEKQLQTEIDFLKSQINPHLLFNTLNTLYSYSLEKSPDTPKMILKLSEIMRYMLYQTNETKVPLSKEITYIKSYVELQE